MHYIMILYSFYLHNVKRTSHTPSSGWWPWDVASSERMLSQQMNAMVDVSVYFYKELLNKKIGIVFLFSHITGDRFLGLHTLQCFKVSC